MNALGNVVCSNWESMNHNIDRWVMSNPDGLAVGEAIGVLTVGGLRATGRIGNAAAAIPVLALLFGAQGSALGHQFFCGNPANDAATSSKVDAYNQYQLSVPERTWSAVSQGAKDLYNFVFDKASSTWDSVWGSTEKKTTTPSPSPKSTSSAPSQTKASKPEAKSGSGQE